MDIMKGRLEMNGWTIFGAAIVVMGILVMVWGTTLYPINFVDSDFMTFFVGGVTLVTLGLLMIPELSSLIKVMAVVIAAVVLMAYIYSFKDMELIIKLMSFVPVIAFAAWLITKIIR